MPNEKPRPGRTATFARTWTPWVAAAAAFAVAPQVVSPYALVLLCYALVFATACLGLNLLLGTTGLLSLGHAAYFGAGAYAGAFLYRFSTLESLEVFILTGVVGATLLATAFGYLCCRATKFQFAILTLALAQGVHALFITGAVFQPLGGVGKGLYLLGGGGLYIPRLTILGAEVGPYEYIPALYRVILGAFLICVVVLWRIDRSPFGSALKAIRDNETRATFVGIPVHRYRWYAFILSGAVVGLAGSLYGPLSRQITPEQLHWLFSAQLVLALVLGGMRDFIGPVAGAFAYVALDELSSTWIFGRNAVLGLLLIVVVLAFPRGLVGGARAMIDRLRGKP